METIADLTARHAKPGRLIWIGARPERRAPMSTFEAIEVTKAGLEGDRSRAGKRAVTLIQAEHLPVIGAITCQDVTPDRLRRNLVITGLNLSALRETTLVIGTSILRITGPCAPCSRMEEELGHGGYNAMRGHGGWCAEVLQEGLIHLEDNVRPYRHEQRQ